MNLGYKEIEECAAFLNEKGFKKPEMGVVLGTGLGAFVHEMDVEFSLDYSEIPNFPVSTVEFHSGKLHYGHINGKKLVVMQGRFHYYEGYTMDQIVFPIRVMKVLGIQSLVVSNAAGAINLGFKKGDIMLIDDHINLLPENPLRGNNIDELGPRFPDMSAPYSERLNEKILASAKKLDIVLRQGVYASVPGPNLETRAEYRYLSRIGADAVGMSTVPEVIAAAHMGLETVALSVLTDECDPDNLQVANIQEIIDIAGKTEKVLIQLVLDALF